MERKKSQLLFNFLPDDTFNHSRNGTIGKVDWIYHDMQSKVDKLPVSYILRRIKPKIERWPNEVPLRPSSVEIVSPDGATFGIFPRVFECRECGACTEFNSDRIESGRTPYCGNCSKPFDDTEQLQFVTVCTCGALDSVPIPTCPNCGDQHPKFVRPTSQMSDSFWVCSDCGDRIGDAYYPLNQCRYCGDRRRIKVHSSSTTFYPQIEKFVNITDEDLEYITNNEAYQKETIVDYLLGVDTADSSGVEEMGVDPKVLERLGVSEEEYREEFEEIEEEREEEREELKEWATNNLSSEKRRIVSEEVFEHNSLTEDEEINGKTIAGLHDDAERRDDIDQHVVDRYLEAKDSLNLESVRMLTDFPITTVVYGYSRLSPGPNEDSSLNTFRGSDGDDRMFAQTSDAEAVMFTLQEEKVLQWLVDNGAIEEYPEEQESKWFLKNMTEYPFFSEVNPEEASEAARYTLALIHTMSHTVMNAVDALSGYSKDSLIEYLFPHALSFVIYKHSDTDFSLGAMHTLVEQRFLEMADYIEDDADLCMYDPVCEEEENASCEDCLYISTISCDNGNHNLSRSTLYGGTFDDEEIDGYLGTE